MESVTTCYFSKVCLWEEEEGEGRGRGMQLGCSQDSDTEELEVGFREEATQ